MQLDEYQERAGSKFYEGIKNIQHGGFPLQFEPDVTEDDEGTKVQGNGRYLKKYRCRFRV